MARIHQRTTTTWSAFCGQKAWKLVKCTNTAQYDDKCTSQRNFYEWGERFKRSWTSTVDDARSGLQCVEVTEQIQKTYPGQPKNHKWWNEASISLCRWRPFSGPVQRKDESIESTYLVLGQKFLLLVQGENERRPLHAQEETTPPPIPGCDWSAFLLFLTWHFHASASQTCSILPWRWRQQVHPKRWQQPTSLHSVKN
jgi:hypothetical protein